MSNDVLQTTTNLNDPSIGLVFYCGDQGFGPRPGDPEWFSDPFSRTWYKVGYEEDHPTPCAHPGTSAVTSQGWLDGRYFRYGVILCQGFLNQRRAATVEAAIDRNEDLLDWEHGYIDFLYDAVGSSVILHELFHVKSWDLSRPQQSRLIVSKADLIGNSVT